MRFNTLVKAMRESKPVKGETSLPTIQDVAQALRMHNGLLSRAAAELGVSPRWLKDLVDVNPDLQLVVWEVKEQLKDLAEERLYNLVRQGKQRAIEFFLSNQAKDRGYGQDPVIQQNFLIDWVNTIVRRRQ